MEKTEKLKIILVDDLTSNDFLEKISKETHAKIISFDYKTHTLLNEKKIQHEISELYLNTNLKELQKKCYTLSKYYELKIIDDNISYCGINIPKLFSDQFLPSMVSVFKKFSEFQSIFNLHPTSIFLASGDLLNIVKLFSNSFIEIDGKKEEKFYFDNIDVGIQIGQKNLKFSISKQFYEKIKQKSDKILSSFFGMSHNSQKFTLLVELNTKNFSNFYMTSKKIGKNILYYGRRRPAIWDLESFKTMKNSKCKMYPFSYINENDIYVKVQKLQRNFLKVIESSNLKNFFIIDDLSLFSVLKPKLINLIYLNIQKSVIEIEHAKKLFKKNLVDSVVVLSEIGMTEQIICNLAHQNKIPIFHLQEGFHYDTLESYENSSSQGVFPEFADHYIVWGSIFKKNAIDFGKTDASKVVEFGSPRFENLLYDEKLNKEDFILLATMPPQIEEIKGIDVRNLKNYLLGIEKICEIITAQKKNIVIKLHPTMDILEISKNLRHKFPNVKVVSSGDINPLIRECSCLIVTGISTVIVQGQILQKPVISIPLINYDFGMPSIYQHEGCKLLKISELDEILKKIEKDPVYKNRLIDNGNKFLHYCFKNNDSSSNIWKYIKNLG